VRADGTLAFAQKYDVETTPTTNLFWAGFALLPGVAHK
jgi:hypothetical protein